MKVALYARYSSDAQRDASIADQLRECRAHAERQSWQIVEEYTDHAISGASLLRPGIQALIADAAHGRFQCVVAEAMDRLSRDQEDIAGLFKRMAFGNVKIVTLSEGEVSQLHVGLKGTMNALFLKDLADKTRRGLRGRVEQGKSGGGNAYGYTVVKRFDGDGDAVRGDRVIHSDEAAVVVRIMRDFAAGKSAKRIATELNRDGVRAPSGGDWGFSTINGNPKRGTGILNNELYVGKLVWNRQRFLKDPVTGKRQARLNDPSEWLSSNVPHLRIVDDELWAAVKSRQRTQRVASPEGNLRDRPRLNEQRRARYLLSGLTRCGKCGGGYSMISTDMLGCSTSRNKGTCANRVNIRRDELERRVLTTLHSHLMDPTLFAEFCDEFTRELNRIRMEGCVAITAARVEVDKLERDMDATIDMMIRLGPGKSSDRLSGKIDRLDARQQALQSFLAVAKEPAALLHPEMAGYYRRKVVELHALLERGPELERMKASEMLRTLVSAIVLTPDDKGLAIDVQGDLAGILAIATAQNAKNPGVFTSGMSQLKMVAGRRMGRVRHSLFVPV